MLLLPFVVIATKMQEWVYMRSQKSEKRKSKGPMLWNSRTWGVVSSRSIRFIHSSSQLLRGKQRRQQQQTKGQAFAEGEK